MDFLIFEFISYINNIFCIISDRNKKHSIESDHRIQFCDPDSAQPALNLRFWLPHQLRSLARAQFQNSPRHPITQSAFTTNLTSSIYISYASSLLARSRTNFIMHKFLYAILPAVAAHR